MLPLRRYGAFGLALVLATPALAQDIRRPAELPPADYAGQQYVDSRGCLFMRAGPQGNEMWLPRVTRDGVPLCGNPPSGNRVPVAGEAGAGEAGALVVAAPGPAAVPAAVPSATSTGAGYYVAVGSFAVAANAEKALVRLKAMNYPTTRGRMQDSTAMFVTVFAGPFDSAAAAARVRSELRGAGFPDAIVIAP